MPNKFLSLVGMTAAFCAALGASSALAAPVDWTLEDLTFTDGTTATGTFEINTYGYLSPNWNMMTSDGAISGWTYVPSINGMIGGGETVVDFYRPGYDGYLQLAFANPLTLGPTDPLDYANSYECATYQSVQGACTGKARSFSSNIAAFVSDAADFPIPEPATMTIIGAGLAAMGLTRLARRK